MNPLNSSEENWGYYPSPTFVASRDEQNGLQGGYSCCLCFLLKPEYFMPF
jgi:hypothetical protein